MRRLPIFAITLILMLVPVMAVAQEECTDTPATQTLFLSITASSGSVDEDNLRLEGVPNVLYISDRPDRTAGFVGLDGLASLWTMKEVGFDADPPNAVLGIDNDGEMATFVIELTGFTQSDDVLNFEITVLEGELQDGSFGAATMFIDGIPPCVCLPSQPNCPCPI